MPLGIGLGTDLGSFSIYLQTIRAEYDVEQVPLGIGLGTDLGSFSIYLQTIRADSMTSNRCHLA